MVCAQEKAEAKKAAASGDGSGSWRDRAGMDKTGKGGGGAGGDQGNLGKPWRDSKGGKGGGKGGDFGKGGFGKGKGKKGALSHLIIVTQSACRMRAPSL